MQISQLDYNTYTGLIGIGRIHRGRIERNQPVTIVDSNGKTRNGRAVQILGFNGLERVEVFQAEAGDIVGIVGIDPLHISDTICDPQTVETLPPLTVDEPTVSMTFQPNTSPFSGQDGKLVTSRNIRNRLEEELKTNVALRVTMDDVSEKYVVSGRGELHLAILIEEMRREGFELAVSRPEVIVRTNEAGEREEPYESVTVDIEQVHQGAVIDLS